jgi:hypothetical protein
MSLIRARTLAASEAEVREFYSLYLALDISKLNIKVSTFKTYKKVYFFVKVGVK